MGTMGELHRVLQFVFRGQLKPVIDCVYPLWSISAHERLEGKDSLARSWSCPKHARRLHMQFLRDVLALDLDFAFALAGLCEVIGKLHP